MTFTPTPTTASKVCIVYSTNKKIVYAHHYEEDDSGYDAFVARLGPGFSVVFIPMSAHNGGHDTFYPAIATALGHPDVTTQFTNGRCVIIDNVSNLVEQVILADDAIDTIQGKTLMNHAIAEVGHSFNPATKQFTAPSFILPAKPGVRATQVIMPAVTYT